MSHLENVNQSRLVDFAAWLRDAKLTDNQIELASRIVLQAVEDHKKRKEVECQSEQLSQSQDLS